VRTTVAGSRGRPERAPVPRARGAVVDSRRGGADRCLIRRVTGRTCDKPLFRL